MSDWLDELAFVWPFSAGADEFIVATLVVALLLGGVGVLLAVFVGQHLDGPVRSTLSGPSSAASASLSALSSTAALARQDRLTVGRLPVGEELWLLAWVRGGRRRLETALFVAGACAGWIRTEGTQLVVVPDDLLLAQFKLALHRTVMTSKHPVHAAGGELEAVMRERAIAAAVARPATRDSMLASFSLFGLAGLAVAEALYFVGGDTSRWPMSKVVIAVSFVFLGVAALTMMGAAFALRQHRQALAYASWITRNVDAVRKDVLLGLTQRDEDIVLIAALDGETAMGDTGDRFGIAHVRSPQVPIPPATRR